MMSSSVPSQDEIEEFVGTMMPELDERRRRIFLGSLSLMLGQGSAKALSEMTGTTPQTITAGRREAREAPKDARARSSIEDAGRVRRPGGGRKRITETHPDIMEKLEGILDGNVIGNPESTLTWTTKGTEDIARELRAMGYPISRETVGTLLKEAGFSLQQNRRYIKVIEPGPDRDAQFRFIQQESMAYIAAGRPVISVDAKKKEWIGNYANKGREYRHKGDPREVLDHDFEGPGGRVTPYGIYDVGDNNGFVSVGISYDTGEFAVNSIRTWWRTVGKERYPVAKDILITADCGGSNSCRSRIWKKNLQDLADEEDLTIHVRHYPPGTSKWNKIEHRLFSYISMGWRGQPLTSVQIVIDLISSVKTKSGLSVKCVLDSEDYESRIRIPDDVMDGLNLMPLAWHGDWNYTIFPHDEK